MNLGFIGTGTITQAVVTGLCKAEGGPTKITLSPRNAERAARLAARFDQVQVADSNQAVLDGSDLVCLAVRPQVAEDILAPLTFASGQQIISFIATFSAEKMTELVAPASVIGRVIPLPPVAQHLGPVAISPANETVENLFGLISRVVVVENDDQLHALWSVTCLMGSYFAFMGVSADWLRDQGVSGQQADRYVGAMFNALGHAAMKVDGEGFAEITTEHCTPQGLNEQALRELRNNGWLDQVADILDLINDRMNGRATFENTLKD